MRDRVRVGQAAQGPNTQFSNKLLPGGESQVFYTGFFSGKIRPQSTSRIKVSVMASYTVWECIVCGWVYDEAKGWPEDDIAPGTRWADIPDDWLCPECGVGKEDFEMIAVGTSGAAEEVDNSSEAAPATPVTSIASEPFKIWECLVCGWVYDEAKGDPEEGIAPGTRWEDIPADWTCPECGVGKDDFEMISVGVAAPAETPSALATTDSVATSSTSAPIVIIGTGLAGYNLAREIRKNDSQTPIIMITADDGRAYSKPLISTGFHKQKTAEAMATASAAEMAEQLQAEIRIFTRVSAIDTGTQEVLIDSQRLHYGKLILAWGAECIEPPLEGTGLDRVFSVNDLMDYTRFRTAMVGAKKVLIIGAGLIGSEYANDLIHQHYDIEAVDPMSSVLASLLPPTASESVQHALENAGVKFHFGTVVKEVNQHGRGVRAVLGNGTTIDADLVLSAVGVRPRIELAQAAGIDTQRGIVVDRSLKTSATNVYALGDCAQVDGHVLYYVSPLMASARALAQTLTGTPTEVYYGAMPVMVKTTLFPVAVNPPARDAEGDWQIETKGENGVKALFRDRTGALLGFALTGECVKEKETLAKSVGPIMQSR